MINLQKTKEFLVADQRQIVIIILSFMVIYALFYKCDRRTESTFTEREAKAVIKKMDSINKKLAKDTLKWGKERKKLEKKVDKSDKIVWELKSELKKKIAKVQKAKQSELARFINKRYGFNPDQVTSIDTSSIKFTNTATRKVVTDLTTLDYTVKELDEQKEKYKNLDSISSIQDSVNKAQFKQYSNLNTKFSEIKKVNDEKDDKIKILEKDLNKKSNVNTALKVGIGVAIVATIIKFFVK
jgi:predicted RNase H-like nuclease (RuvC/YqgF family)